MKKFKVQVQNGKAEFFRELLKNLDFVDFEEVDDFHEPRIYPGGNFEIRSPNESRPENEMPNVNKRIDTQGQGMEDIRKVLSKIDAMRDKKKH